MINFSETSDAFKTELMGGNKFTERLNELRQMVVQMPEAREDLQTRLIVTLILFGVAWHLDQNLDNKVADCQKNNKESEENKNCKKHKWFFALKIIFGIQLGLGALAFMGLFGGKKKGIKRIR